MVVVVAVVVVVAWHQQIFLGANFYLLDSCFAKLEILIFVSPVGFGRLEPTHNNTLQWSWTHGSSSGTLSEGASVRTTNT